jgi:hypothetical protein
VKPDLTRTAIRGVLAALAMFCVVSEKLRAQQAESIDELDTVLVTGEHPGPGLWKVSKGDHVMWVLGTYGPLPRDMIWGAQNVEARIAESQEVLYPGAMQLDLDVGFFKRLTLIPAALSANKLPDHKKLQDVLPSETYNAWRLLRDKYLGNNDSLERQRPAFAMSRLREAAYRKHKLSNGPVVSEIVSAAAKKHKVRVHRLPDVKPEVKIAELDEILEAMSKVEVPDAECFATGIGRVESDIAHLKSLANAWSRGDIDALRDLHRKPVVGNECGGVLRMALTAGDSAASESAKKLVRDMDRASEEGRLRQAEDWLRAAEAALQKNKSTFAVLSIRAVVADNGYVAKLKELGYEVEGQ